MVWLPFLVAAIPLVMIHLPPPHFFLYPLAATVVDVWFSLPQPFSPYKYAPPYDIFDRIMEPTHSKPTALPLYHFFPQSGPCISEVSNVYLYQ